MMPGLLTIFATIKPFARHGETYELQGRGQVYFLFAEERSHDFDFVISLVDLELIGAVRELFLHFIR
jgi:hypothetical protein